jgi:predicted Ser/Thr protein kinase
VHHVAQLFPQLEILELIGQGGMGAVYKARQPALDRLVALKVLPPRPGSDRGFTERFTREARALAKLSHPNIVAVHEFGRVQFVNGTGVAAGGESLEQPYLHYFVMEFVDGANLRQIERAGRLTPRDALRIIPQICEALQFAHDEGIVHRDIKPENVLVDKKGRVKIADFGLARILALEKDLRLTGARDVMGTPHYMAPEQVEHPQAVDHRADIYSLGVVFYEMLTGELPLGKFQPPSHKVEVDVRLDEVVLHALEKEPERRYQQASQVKTDVQTIVEGSGSPAHASAPRIAVQTSQPPKTLRRVSAAAMVTVVFGLLVIWLVHAFPGVRGKSTRVLPPDLVVVGTVRDVTGKPIAGARVADTMYGPGAQRAPQEAWTDVTGHYQLKTWNEEHMIAASAPGCELVTSLLRSQPVSAGGKAELNFRLMPAEGEPLPVPPVVVSTIPESGAVDVDPQLTELQVTFSSPMLDQSWSWSTRSPETFPEVNGPIHYQPDGRTCVLPVKLQPGKTYATWLNSPNFHNFQDRQGRPSLPYLLIFETRKRPVNP